MIWRVWPIHHPDLVDEEEPVKGFTIDGPRAAVEIACDGDLDFCEGVWFADAPVVALIVESPEGERWTCAAWLTPSGPARFAISDPQPMEPR